ncbi:MULTISPECIES: hypothetical protein [Acinetobacter]|uniref:hypothetical protein n=1 Tax=Acinetobacter TaxID=469 RepID=UPI0002CEFE3D|nr:MULTISPECIES: hypothetical protein [Acinetobacter]ENW89568.1 hypothetical protein F905_01353 [Acinetobacter sp. CIP 53.82]MBA0154929.1 hypothetical protein [Acinetobacter indicus]
MQNVMDMKRNKPDIISFIKQAGVSSLLFIVLVGLSLTVLTVGYMSTMRNLQSSATTTHAQTQAQMQAMIGYHAFSKYLNQLSKEDNGLRLIDQLCNGEIEESNPETQIKFERVGACNNPVLKDQYKFDIIGKSGGASAILRANYNITSELSKEQFKGSVFEGGLQVNKLESLIADGVTLEVGGGNILQQSGTPWSSKEISEAGITLKAFSQRDFLNPTDVRKDANYIFYTDGNNIPQCRINNVYKGGAEIKTETVIGTNGQGADCNIGGVSYDASNKLWIVNSNASNKIPGVLWFDGNVKVNVWKSKLILKYTVEGVTSQLVTNYPGNILVNSIVATGKIESSIVEQSSDSTIKDGFDALKNQFKAIPNIPNNIKPEEIVGYDIFAPHHYILDAVNDTDRASRLAKVCPAEYPLQYCQSQDALKTQSQLEDYPASIANVLYLARNLELIGGKDGGTLVLVNYYGNLLANSAAGGTGGASGKLIGTGTVRIEGNLMVVGTTDMTEMSGDFKLNLSKADDPGNFVPVYKKTFGIGGIRYM